MFASDRCQDSADPADHQGLHSWMVSTPSATWTRYDTKLWMRDLMEGAAYLPK